MDDNTQDALRRIALGFGDLFADAGDHIGHFYRTEQEWLDVSVPFLALGLEQDHKCVCVAETERAQKRIRQVLGNAGHDVSAALASGQLVLTPGHGTVDGMQGLLTDALTEVPGRFRFLRWVGDMTWAHGRMPDSETLLEWESACNVIEDARVVFLCQYELSRFPGTAVVDAMRTHPLCVVGNTIHRNPFYEEPGAFLADVRQRDKTPLGNS